MSPKTSLSSLSTVWVYVRIQLVVFVCGIVGPIFLFVYFAAQPEPTIKWMYYTGLIITAIDILIALGITSNAVKARGAKTAPPE